MKMQASLGGNRRIEARTVETAEQRQSVHRFWYDVYVRQMHRPVRDVDHVRQVIVDSLEESSLVIAACRGEEIVGTVRLNETGHGQLGFYAELYGLDARVMNCPGTAIVTKFMTLPRHRTTVPFLLARAALQECLRRRVETAFMDCNPPLHSYFEALGFRDHITDAEHPEFGRVHVMKYDLTRCAELSGLLGRGSAAIA